MGVERLRLATVGVERLRQATVWVFSRTVRREPYEKPCCGTVRVSPLRRVTVGAARLVGITYDVLYRSATVGVAVPNPNASHWLGFSTEEGPICLHLMQVFCCIFRWTPNPKKHRVV